MTLCIMMICFMICVIYFDFVFYIIPNFIPIAITILALIYWGLHQPHLGLHIFILPLMIFILGFVLSFLGILGFGDSKLIASLSLILGVHYTVYLVLYTVLLGAVLAVCFLLFKKSVMQLRAYLQDNEFLHAFHRWIIPDLPIVIEDAKALQHSNHMPYGIPIALSGIYLILIHYCL